MWRRRVACFQCDRCDWTVPVDPLGDFLDKMTDHEQDHTGV